MTDHAFFEWKVNRVAIQAGEANTKSRAGAELAPSGWNSSTKVACARPNGLMIGTSTAQSTLSSNGIGQDEMTPAISAVLGYWKTEQL